MIPPTSIDGTDITGATIDGNDVTEITVDGQTVFSAESLPAISNGLVSWFPFENNLQDFNNTFTSTATSVTRQTTGGVTDVNTGTSSGYAEFGGVNNTATIEINDSGQFVTKTANGNPFTMMCWMWWTNSGSLETAIGGNVSLRDCDGIFPDPGSNRIIYASNDGGTGVDARFAGVNTPTGEWIHVALSNDGQGFSNMRGYFNGQRKTTGFGFQQNRSLYTGNTFLDPNQFGGIQKYDDVRFYNRQLSDSEILTIYQNTKP